MSQAPQLKDFISEMSKGLARPNRFFVLFPKDLGDQRMMGMFCETTQLPGSTLLTTPAKTFGESREVAYERQYEPINMTFYVDANFKVKEYFDNWHNAIFNPHTRAGGYYKEYVKTIEIWVHNVEDKRTYAVRLNECYPKAINAIELDYGSKDIMKMQVTMQYKNWKAVAGEAAASEAALANIENPPVQAQGDTFAALDMDNLIQGFMSENSLSGYLSDFQSFQGELNGYASELNGYKSQVASLESYAKDPVGSYLGGNNFNISF